MRGKDLLRRLTGFGALDGGDADRPIKPRHRHVFTNFLHFERYGATYANNPKAACTTIKTLLSAGEEIPPNLDVHQWGVLTHALGQVDEHHARQIVADTMLFTFVRHPQKRILSAYQDKVKQFHWRMTNRPPLGARRRRNYGGAVRRYRAITETVGLPQSELVPLDAFLDYLEIVFTRKYTEGEDQEVDRHFDLQSTNIRYGEVEFDFVGRVESMQEDLAKLGSILGTEFQSPGRMNRTSNTPRPTPSQVVRIERLFAEDYRLLGY